MYTVRRKWTHHGLRLAIIGLVLGGAWIVRQTQGALIVEIYALVTRPFQGEGGAVQEQLLVDQRIQELQQKLIEVERQNQQLKALLGYYRATQQPAIAAPIIGRSADDWWQQVILGRGTKDGVQVGAAVTGIGGLVGRVTEVTPSTSRVLLVSNPLSRVGATVSRSRSMGTIQGQGSQIAVMRFFEKAPDVHPGDVVTTSMVSRLFPSGLPIGRVRSVDLEQGPAPEAKIEFTAAIDNLEWAIVHPIEHP